MIWFLYGLAFFWIAVGTAFILYTEESRQFLKDSLAKVKWKFLAFIPMAVGLLLILSASSSGAPWFIVILGVLAIGKGVYFLLGPQNQIQSLLDWWYNSAQERTYRFGGLIMVVLGLVLLSWV